MNSPSELGRSSQWAFDHPQFLPLQGQSATQAHALLQRKGGLLTPPLTRAEAQDIIAFMSLEHFAQGSLISFDAQSMETGRLMLILVGEAHIRMRGPVNQPADSEFSPTQRAQAKWFSAGEGATLGLIHAFSGLSSRFVAQAASELFVASLTREAFQIMKKQSPALALRFLEITALELALVALDHEKRILALTQVARSMQDHIAEETGETAPTPLPSTLRGP
jgi:CRP-like cAMP-binding protein